MVEVWLSYRDTEIPLMLPDPIDLKIAPKTIMPEARESEAVAKLYRILKGLDTVNIAFNPIADDIERNYIIELLSKTELNYKIVDYNEANIIIDIFRYDPIIGFKSSLWTEYLYKDTTDKLLELCEENKADPLKYASPSSGKKYIDLIIDGGPRLVNVFHSEDGGHFTDAKKFYVERWCLKSQESPLIISSVGGAPWDLSIQLIISSIIKLKSLLSEESIGVLVGDGILKNFDPSKLKSIDREHIESVTDVYLYYLLNKLNFQRTIVYYGSIPSTVMKYLFIKRIRDLEAYIKSLPMRRKRDILVIEDLTLLYPYQCSETQL